MKAIWPLFGLLLIGCAAAPQASSRDDEESEEDEARSAAEEKTDPTGGRDATSTSCFAACQNVSLTCIAKKSAKTSEVSLQLDGSKGCTGTLGSKSLTVQCLGKNSKPPQVCIADDCQDGTFSAFTFGFGDSVCTRN